MVDAVAFETMENIRVAVLPSTSENDCVHGVLCLVAVAVALLFTRT